MENLKFKKKSWHYAVASYGNEEFEYNVEFRKRYQDICSYSKAVGWGFLKILWDIAKGVFVGGIYLMLSHNIAENAFTSSIVTSHPFLGFFVWLLFPTVLVLGDLLVVLLVLGTIYLLLMGTKAVVKGVSKNDKFLPEAYKSWKNKFCRKIDFE